MELKEKDFVKDKKTWTIIPTVVVTRCTGYKYKKSLTFEFWFLCFSASFIFAE